MVVLSLIRIEEGGALLRRQDQGAAAKGQGGGPVRA